jgi:hypothetical protein
MRTGKEPTWEQSTRSLSKLETKENKKSNGGSATLQKAVAQRSVSFFQLRYSKVTVSAEFLNLTLIFFSKRKKNFSVELAHLG